MPKPVIAPSPAAPPGDVIRAARKRLALTLSEVSDRTGLAISTLSKLEKGNVSLSYDKLMLLSRAFGIDVAELLSPASHTTVPQGGGRRVVVRAGEGHLVETQSYRQLYLATEMLNKRFTPMVVELRAQTIDEFNAEFGGLIRHPGEEFVQVLEGEVEFHSELYAPVKLKVGDSLYFDSEMGHAYLNATDGPCRVLCVCAPLTPDDCLMARFESASERHSAQRQNSTLLGPHQGSQRRSARRS